MNAVSLALIILIFLISCIFRPILLSWSTATFTPINLSFSMELWWSIYIKRSMFIIIYLFVAFIALDWKLRMSVFMVIKYALILSLSEGFSCALNSSKVNIWYTLRRQIYSIILLAGWIFHIEFYIQAIQDYKNYCI